MWLRLDELLETKMAADIICMLMIIFNEENGSMCNIYIYIYLLAKTLGRTHYS